MLRRSIPVCVGLWGLFMASQAVAGISLSSTRIVFDGANKEANITVRNGTENALVQSWIDPGESGISDVPFAVTPPLARVPANEQQLLRILYEGKGMPADKESVFWLNVQEIPKAAKGTNTLQLAVRQRIKIFFRPAGLAGEARKAPEELSWKLVPSNGKSVLKVKNPSRFHVSMADVTLEGQQTKEVAVDSTMVAPGEEKEFDLKKFPSQSSVKLSFLSINDYGAQIPFTAKIEKGQLANASPSQEKSAR